MSALDKRLHAVRPDLADARLQGLCEATRFVEGTRGQCGVPVARVHLKADTESMQVTQMLMGEALLVFERTEEWSWVQLVKDGYVGYVRPGCVRAAKIATTHRITVPLGHLYPKPDIKSQPAVAMPMNAELAVAYTDGDFHCLASGGFIHTAQARTSTPGDFVSVAEQFLHVPYLWGGRTAIGIDCSGLVQTALHACGIDAPRDSDMQENRLGTDASAEKRKRGDLIFWKGHVGIMQNEITLLHANGHHMKVVSEPLQTAIDRIAAKGSAVTSIRKIVS